MFQYLADFISHYFSDRLGELKIVMIISAVVTGAIGVLLVVFGALATGSTRKNVYSGTSCILGGRCSAIFVSVSHPQCYWR